MSKGEYPEPGNCILCEQEIKQYLTGEPYLVLKGKPICFHCYLELIPSIYQMAGAGDGGMIHILYQQCLSSTHNRKNRKQITNYKKMLNKLLHKYNFTCVYCGAKKKLTVDHIIPVSRNGTDDINNLQIACKNCNSRKGNKTHEEYLTYLQESSNGKTTKA